jgi:hypothetical protein
MEGGGDRGRILENTCLNSSGRRKANVLRGGVRRCRVG